MDQRNALVVVVLSESRGLETILFVVNSIEIEQFFNIRMKINIVDEALSSSVKFARKIFKIFLHIRGRMF